MAQIVAEGKTKILQRRADGLGRVVSKDDTTAGDGKRREIVPNKGVNSTRMSGSIMQLLMYCGFKVAYVRDDPTDPRAFETIITTPYPFEVVGRIRADGSILERQPELVRRQLLPAPVSELYLKTSGKVWTSVLDGSVTSLTCDDPYALPNDDSTILYHPRDQVRKRKPIAIINNVHVFRHHGDWATVAALSVKAIEILRVLEYACSLVEIELDDFKVEFGYTGRGVPYLIDVIDFDSWRAWHKGGRIDKQGFRDGESVEETARKFQLAADLVEVFRERWFQEKVRLYASA